VSRPCRGACERDQVELRSGTQYGESRADCGDPQPNRHDHDQRGESQQPSPEGRLPEQAHPRLTAREVRSLEQNPAVHHFLPASSILAPDPSRGTLHWSASKKRPRLAAVGGCNPPSAFAFRSTGCTVLILEETSAAVKGLERRRRARHTQDWTARRRRHLGVILRADGQQIVRRRGSGGRSRTGFRPLTAAPAEGGSSEG
jgi:hypothetical protein